MDFISCTYCSKKKIIISIGLSGDKDIGALYLCSLHARELLRALLSLAADSQDQVQCPKCGGSIDIDEWVPSQLQPRG